MKPVARGLVAAVSLLGLSFFAGCKKSENQAPAERTALPASAAEASKAPAAPGAGEPAPANPITEEDFESEAERDVNADNLEAALDQIEREIQEK